METIREVLNRILTTPPGRQTARQASKFQDLSPSSNLVPLGTLPKRRSEENDNEPLFTPEDLHRLREYVKMYANGYALLCQLERTKSRPGLSDSETMLVTRLMHETLALIEPFEPVVAALTKFCAKLAKVESRCRECAEEISKVEVDSKLDRVLSGLDRVERTIRELSTEKPITTLDELCRRFVAKN